MADHAYSTADSIKLDNRVANVTMPLTLRAGLTLPQYSISPTLTYTHFFGSPRGITVTDIVANEIVKDQVEPDNLLSLHMRFEYPSHQQTIRWFGTLGPAYLWKTSTVTLIQGSTAVKSSLKDTHFGVHLGIGSSYRINPNIDLTQEISVYRFRTNSNVKVNTSTGYTHKSSLRPSMLNATIGITYHLS